MLRRTRGLGALMLGAAMLAGCASGGTGSPSPAANSSASATISGDASASPVPIPPLSSTFTSPLMGFSVHYPAEWTATAATQLWLPNASNFWDDPIGDRLESAVAGFRGTSQALAAGQTAEAWLTEYLASGPSCGVEEQLTVGSSVGTLDMNGCDGRGRLGGRVFDYAVVVGGRGYNFTMEGEVDHAFLMAMLATVQFMPEAAATPAPSG